MRKTSKRFHIALLFVMAAFTLWNCSGKETESIKEDLYTNTEYFYLEDQSAKLLLPQSYYREEADLQAVDSRFLEAFDNHLELKGIANSTNDYFLDRSGSSRILFVDNQYTPLNEAVARNYSAFIRYALDDIGKEKQGFNAERISSAFKENENFDYVKVKYRLSDQSVQEEPYYLTLYFLSTKYKQNSFFIQEYSKGEKDLEPYLWSLKGA